MIEGKDNLIKTVRRFLRITENEFARKLNISVTSLYGLEKKKEIPFKYLAPLSKILGVSEDRLYILYRNFNDLTEKQVADALRYFFNA